MSNQILLGFKCPYCEDDNELQEDLGDNLKKLFEIECVCCERHFQLYIEAKAEIYTFEDELVDLAKAKDEEIKELERLGK